MKSKLAVAAIVLITSGLSFADVDDDMREGVAGFDWQACINAKMSDCMNGCQTSTDTDCKEGCTDMATDKCKSEGLQPPA